MDHRGRVELRISGYILSLKEKELVYSQVQTSAARLYDRKDTHVYLS